MNAIVSNINSIIWSPALIYLCLAAGLFYTVLTRFVQVRLFKEMIHLLRSNQSSEKGISSFQALSISLSGRVGTGNIAGVAAAIGFGGPGAIFWMWMVALFGAATAFIEATLAQIYKEVDNGEYRGGPAYYIEKAMGQTWYAWIFALATILACGLLLPTLQSNAIGEAVARTFGNGSEVTTAMGTFSSTKIITGLFVTTLLGFIIFGGVKRIAHVAQTIVPLMAVAYIICACTIILLNLNQLPGIISLILDDAFTPMAGFGAAIGWGVKRGVYSNEAGQGTAPHAAAAAEVQHPAQQGLVQAFSIYVDTLFVCTATAFMILITGMYNVGTAETGFIIQNIGADVAADGPSFSQMAIESVMPAFGNPFIAAALFFFSFTTLMAYYYIAESNIVYLKRFIKLPRAVTALKRAILFATFFGTIKTATLVWALGDIGVGLMAWINIIGILIIFFNSKPAITALKDYESQRKAGVKRYIFNPKKLGIKNAHFWNEQTRSHQEKEHKDSVPK